MRLALGFVALIVAATGPASADYVWRFDNEEMWAALSVVDEAEIDNEDAFAPFYMECYAGGDTELAVSDVDPAALGQSISAGEVPRFAFVIDGAPVENDAMVIHIAYNNFYDVWEYVSKQLPFNALYAASTATVVGVGYKFDLPEENLAEMVATFVNRCNELART